jgi:hypothetical protein
LGEGVFWRPTEKALYWVDMAMPSFLHRWNPKTGEHENWPMPEMITHGCAVLMFPPCAAAAARPELDNAQPSVAPKVDLSVTKHGVRVPR